MSLRRGKRDWWRRTFHACLVVIILMSTLSPVLQASSSAVDGLTAAEAKELLEKLVSGESAESTGEIRTIQAATLERPPGPGVTGSVYSLAALLPNDPLLPQQWALGAIEAEAAWNTVTRAAYGAMPPVVVAVIDNGFDTAHPDLAGRLLPLIDCSGDGEIPCVDAAPGVRAVNKLTDGEERGTHAAGIIAATANNGIGITGAAGTMPVSILPVQAADSAFNVAAAVSRAMEWRGASGERVSVIYIGPGFREYDPPTYLSGVIAEAYAQQIVIVAGGGDDGTPVRNGETDAYYPAALPQVISAGALSRLSVPLAGSNPGTTVMAPGEEILSALPSGQYGTKTGSASAAAYVAAAAALVRAVQPELTAGEVRQAITAGASGTSWSMNRTLLSVLPDPGDRTAPVWPAGSVIHAPAVGHNAVRLEWTPAVGETGLIRYVLYQDGAPLPGGSESPANIRGLTPGTSYVFKVEAADLSGNRTTDGPYVTIQTKPPIVTEKISVNGLGEPGNGDSRYSSVSEDGRWVVFGSEAANLVAGDTNGKEDIFLRDRMNRVTKRISMSQSGLEANGSSHAPVMSMDGRFVLFSSFATNLLAAPGSGSTEDLYLYDGETGGLEKVAEDVSAGYVYVYERPYAMSENGRYVAFASYGTNGVEDDFNNNWDVFVKDRWSGQTTRITDRMYGSFKYPHTTRISMTPDGRYIVFTSDEHDLVPGDTNGRSDVFVYDRKTGLTERVSLSSSGEEGNSASESGSISADGRYVVFTSYANNFIPGDDSYNLDLFVRDRIAKTTEIVNVTLSAEPGFGSNESPSISANGRWIVFYSNDELHPGAYNRNVYLHDRETLQTELMSASPAGEPGNADSIRGAVSWNGKYAVFDSVASNLAGEPEGESTYGHIYFRELPVYANSDRTPPVWGEGAALAAAQTGGSYAALRWTPALDEASPAIYKVYRDGVLLDIVPEPAYLVTGLSPGRTYSFAVEPGDTFYNWSAARISASASTLAQPETTPPETASGIALLPELGGLEVRWTDPASLDYVGTIVKWRKKGAIGYKETARIAPGVQTAAMQGLTNGTEYEVVLVSLDADGNRSESAPATARVTQGRQITRVNVSGSGEQSNQTSLRPDVSDDGRYVVFDSDADHLAERDGNGKTDVFLYDRVADTIELISKTGDGASADNISFEPKISGDGRYIVFTSYAGNLITDDAAGPAADVFLYDRHTGRMAKISYPAEGGAGNGDSYRPAVSGDGSRIVFLSYAKLVPDAPDQLSVYLYERETDSVSLLRLADGTIANDDSGPPAISGNGQYIAFATEASNMDRTDTDRYLDVYLFHIPDKTVKRISTFPGDRTISYDPSISEDGRYVAFKYEDHSDYNLFPVIYVYDRDRDETVAASRSVTGGLPDGDSESPSISGDGRYVLYASRAANLAAGDSNGVYDVYAFDRHTGETAPLSLTYAGGWASGSSRMPAVSGDGMYVVFESEASDLITGDTNGVSDLFLALLQAPPPDDTVPPVFPEGGRALVKEAGADFVTLSWPAASDDRAVAGYRVSYGGTSYVSFPGTATEGTVWGLLPGTEYTFTVKAADAAGNESANGLTVVAATKSGSEVRLNDVRATTERSGSGYASLNGTVRLEAEGSPGGSAEARIDYVKADDTTDSLLIPLTASGAASPLYAGEFAIPEGAKQIRSAEVTLTVASASVKRSKTLDIPVGGSLKLHIRSEDGSRLQNAVLTLSGGALQGEQKVTLTGNGSYTFGGLPSGEGYELKLRSSLGRELPLRESDQGYTVRQGLTAEATVHLRVFLQVVYAGGGIADITWSIPADETDLAGFVIYRKTGGADPAEVGRVNDPSVTKFTDAGLASGASYSYEVHKRTTSGTQTPFSDEVTVFTPELSIADPLWNADTIRVGGSKYAVTGSGLQVRFKGEANRSAKMTVEYKTWFDAAGQLLEEPAQQTKEIAMEPDPEAPNGYKGTFVLEDGISEVRRVKLSVTDASGRSTEREVTGLYYPVAGKLKVNVYPIPEDFGKYDGNLTVRGKSYATWSEIGTGGGEIAIPLPSGTDYSFTIMGSNRTVIWNRENIEIRNGLQTEAQLEPPARVRITVLDAKGQPLPNVKYVLRGKRGSVDQGKTGPDGIIVSQKALFVGETVTLTTDMSDQPAYKPFTASFVLDREHYEQSVSPVAKPSGTLYGSALDPAGKPTPDAAVHIYNESFRSVAAVDENGMYSMEVPAGSVTVEAVSKSNALVRSKPARMDVTEGERVQRDPKLLNMDARVNINLYTKLPGGNWQGPLDLDWRVAIHMHLTSTHSVLEHGNPARIRAQEGDVVQICADGREAGLSKKCAETTIDENRNGAVDLYLESAGSSVTGTIVHPEGSASASYRGDLYRLSEQGRLNLQRIVWLNSGPFRLDIAEEGNYMLYVSDNPSRPTAAQTVSFRLGAGELKPLGDIRLGSSGKFKGRSGTSLQLLSGPATLGSAAAIRISYANTGEPRGQAEQAKLTIGLPEGTAIVPGSVTVGGQPGEARMQGQTAEISLGTVAAGASGVVLFQLSIDQVDSNQEKALSASLRYTYGAEEREELLGVLPVDTVPITLAAPETVTGYSMKVNGKAPAGEQVTVYDGNVPLGQAVSSPAGYWYLSVQLPESREPEHRLRAETIVGGRHVSSATALVNVDPEAALLEEMSMMQADGRRMTFRPSEGQAIFPYVVVPGKPFLFEMSFSQPERISDVTVQMGNNIANAQKVDGLFKATIPTTDDIGPVWVSYRVKPKWVPDTAGGMPTEEQFRSRLPSRMQNYTIEKITIPDADLNAVLNGTADSAKSAVIDAKVPGDMNAQAQITVQRMPNYEPTPDEYRQAEYTGLPVYGTSVSYKKKGNSLVIDFSINIPAEEIREAGSLAAGLQRLGQKAAGTTGKAGQGEVRIMSGGKKEMIKLALQLTLDALTDHVPDVMALIDKLKSLKDLAGASKLFEKAEKLLIRAQNLCDPRASEYYTRWAEEIGTTIMIHEGIKWTLQAAGLVLGPETLGLSTALGFWLSGLLAENVLDSLVEDEQGKLEKALDQFKCKLKPYPEKKPQADPKFIWDPSGYVYEGLPDNRVPDVKATVLEQDPVSGLWNVWDAAWYGQANPQYTNGEGRYGWDVPKGRWQVMYEKDGYETAYSHEMEVLPPHFDVNVPIVSYQPPEVTSVTARPGGGSVDVYFSKPVNADDLAPELIRLDGREGTVSGSVYGIGPVTVGGRMLAYGIRFQPAAPLTAGETYVVTVSRLVTSYADIPLQADVRRTVAVHGQDAAAPSEVGGVSEGMTSDSITLIWNDPADADFDKVRVYWKKSSDPAYGAPLDVSKGTKWVSVSGLEQGDYSFRLATADTNGNESAGVVLMRTIGERERDDYSPPLPILDLRVTAAEADRLQVAWTDSVAPDLAKLILSWKPVGSFALAKTAAVDPGVGTYTISGLEPNTEYELTIQAVDRSGNPSIGSLLSASTKPANGKPLPGPGGGGGYAPVPPKSPGAGSEWIIEPKGGTYAAYDGKVKVVVQEGAVPAGSKMTVVQSESPAAQPGSGYTLTSPAYELNLGTIRPKQPLTLLIEYDPALLNGLDAARLGLYKRNTMAAAGWVYAGGIVQEKEHRVRTDVTESGQYAVLLYERSFSDMPGHWSRPDVDVLVSRHIVNGVSENRFEPDRAITRAEMTKMLVETLIGAGLQKPDAPEAPTFRDVSKEAWYYAYVETASRAGIAQGADGMFRPGDPVTREEMSLFVGRAVNLLSRGASEQPDDDTSLDRFEDAGRISEWAKAGMARAISLGFIQGMTDRTIEPQAEASRAQAAVLLLRLLARYGYISE
ncbi:fibronectin type III domain-containing protein [Paenibacillus sp. GYB004]|uniref:fibronectin type III domain-containing protein n=1 Tax=Paenibacillus sp. GYB004 TaxID=2994393 RepID=UPI002F96D38F